MENPLNSEINLNLPNNDETGEIMSLEKEFDEEFKYRFTDKDDIFTAFCKQEQKPPPIVFPFDSFHHRNNRRGHREGRFQPNVNQRGFDNRRHPPGPYHDNHRRDQKHHDNHLRRQDHRDQKHHDNHHRRQNHRDQKHHVNHHGHQDHPDQRHHDNHHRRQDHPDQRHRYSNHYNRNKVDHQPPNQQPPSKRVKEDSHEPSNQQASIETRK